LGRRGEQRISVSLPVIVRGLDSRGSPYTVNTQTCDISYSGACVNGLSELAVPGAKLEIETQGQRAWYRVQWVGKNGSIRAGRVGIRCLEPGRYIWGVASRGWEPDTYEPPISPPVEPIRAAPARGPWAGRERRQFARHACRIEAELTTIDGSITLPGKITDISLGGCYVEMLSPLPIGAAIQLAFNLEDSAVRLSGGVCSSQMGLGMGVAFTAMSPDQFEKLRQFAPPSATHVKTESHSVGTPAAASPRVPQPRIAAPQASSHSYSGSDFDSLDLPATAESLEAIVHLLLRKGLLTRAELLEELEKLKTSKA
jgi:hypothetical protein